LTRKELEAYEPEEIGKPLPGETICTKKRNVIAYQCSVCKKTRKAFSEHPKQIHKIPTDPELAKKWLQVFPKLQNNHRSKICSHHFLDVDYENNSKLYRLKSDGENKCD
jgi:THAP domain